MRSEIVPEDSWPVTVRVTGSERSLATPAARKRAALGTLKDMPRALSPFLAALALTTACAPSMRASAKSVSEHDAAAKANAEVAAAHDRAKAGAKPCADMNDLYEICWTRWDTPEEHRFQAQKHRRLAAAHRAESDALRVAESEACVGIAEVDRDISPFLHSEDILATERLDPAATENWSTVPVVRVTFRAVPGLDEKALSRLVGCHLARNAALGHDVPEMDFCPLVPPGVEATVGKVGDQLFVTIAAHESTLHEVRRRAETLAERAR